MPANTTSWGYLLQVETPFCSKATFFLTMPGATIAKTRPTGAHQCWKRELWPVVLMQTTPSIATIQTSGDVRYDSHLTKGVVHSGDLTRHRRSVSRVGLVDPGNERDARRRQVFVVEYPTLFHVHKTNPTPVASRVVRSEGCINPSRCLLQVTLVGLTWVIGTVDPGWWQWRGLHVGGLDRAEGQEPFHQFVSIYAQRTIDREISQAVWWTVLWVHLHGAFSEPLEVLRFKRRVKRLDGEPRETRHQICLRYDPQMIEGLRHIRPARQPDLVPEFEDDPRRRVPASIGFVTMLIPTAWSLAHICCSISADQIRTIGGHSLDIAPPTLRLEPGCSQNCTPRFDFSKLGGLYDRDVLV